MSIHLSKRLSHIAAFVEPNARLADIGTDHAYLPIALAQAGQVDFAVASDVGAGPTAIAKANVEQAGLSQVIDVRQADGLLGLTEQDAIDTIVIAGMGGILTIEILTAGMDHLDGTETLILEPNRDVEAVRRFLAAHEFGILDEDLIEDDGHVYPIVVAGQTKPEVPYTEAELILGPVMLRKQTPLFKQQLEREIEKTQVVLTGLTAGNDVPAEKLDAIKSRLAVLKEAAHGIGLTTD